MSKFIPIISHKVVQSRSYTTLILGTENKAFAICMEPQVGKDLKVYLSGGKKRRPSSLNLLQSVLASHDIRPFQVLIHDVEETIYHSRLFLETAKEGKRQIVEIDCRPSDSLTLALLLELPIFCRQEVLEKTIAIEEID